MIYQNHHGYETLDRIRVSFIVRVKPEGHFLIVILHRDVSLQSSTLF